MFNLSFAEKKNRGETHRQGHEEKGMEREFRELQTIGEIGGRTRNKQKRPRERNLHVRTGVTRNRDGVMDKDKCSITEHFEDGAPGPGLYVALTPSSAVTDTRPVFF